MQDHVSSKNKKTCPLIGTLESQRSGDSMSNTTNSLSGNALDSTPIERRENRTRDPGGDEQRGGGRTSRGRIQPQSTRISHSSPSPRGHRLNPYRNVDVVGGTYIPPIMPELVIPDCDTIVYLAMMNLVRSSRLWKFDILQQMLHGNIISVLFIVDTVPTRIPEMSGPSTQRYKYPPRLVVHPYK